MKTFFVLCLTFLLSILFVISGFPCYAQEIDEPVVTYTEPKIVSGNPARCKIVPLSDRHQISITFPDASASSLEQKKDSLKCRVETDTTIQLTKGWYLHSIEHTITGGVVQSPQSKALLAIQSKFQGKNILRLRETKSAGLISRSNKILASFAWSKVKQCSGKIARITGNIILNLDFQTQGNAQAYLTGFDAFPIFAQCDL